MQGAAVFGLLASRSAVPIYLCAAVVGFGYGGTGPQLPVLAAKIFGLSALGSIFGALVLSGQIGGAIGPYLAGKMFDLTQSYFGGFSMGGISVAIAGLLLILVKAPRMESRQNSE
jgi:MFS family permease